MPGSSREEQNRYFKGLSGLALAQLGAGLFFTISVVGVYVSIISFAESPWWITLFWAGFTGTFAILYFVAAIRSLRILPVIIVVQVGATIVASKFVTARPLPHTPFGTNILVQATIMLVCSLLGYALFFSFIKTEGIARVRTQTELALAHDLQHTLVPRIALTTPRFEIYGATLPSEKVGGDLVDCIACGDTILAYVADVSGHGIPAGVLMGMVKAAMHTQVQWTSDVASMLASLNRVLPHVKQPNMYATLACMRVHNDSAVAEYALAGHLPILHYRASDGDVKQLSSGGPPVGLVPAATFATAPVHFSAGDIFVLFTDGCVEVANGADEEFGSHRLEYAIVHHATDPLPVLHDCIMDEIGTFGRQQDDQSLLMIRVV